ncbi:MAG: DUF5011 domain-containing protein [Chitinispirillaceae bacterium]|nr:DUF5011 domain-containing protein [Chitinispirillaceae bacterium]
MILRAAKWNESNNYLQDTVGNTIEVGAAIFLPENIDSIALQITTEGVVVFDTIFRDFHFGSRDTAWKKIVFYTAGNKIVMITPYSSLNISSASATIEIIGKELPENHKPAIYITGNKPIQPTETCSLTVQISDSDEDQTLSVSILESPSDFSFYDNSLFTWTPPADFIGYDTVVFIVTDDGLPPMSDTDTTIITVTMTPHSPSIQVYGDRTVSPLETCTLTISVSDEDPGQTLEITMSDNPEGSELKNDSLFVWTVPESFIGEVTVNFKVTDNGNPPLSTFFSTVIAVSDVSVNHAPKWVADSLPIPLNDTSLCYLPLSTICSDDDGDRLNYTLLPGKPAGDTIIEGAYSYKATPAAVGSYDVAVVAADPDDAKDTLIIRLTVESDSIDTTPPAITLISPDGDSAVTNTETYSIDVICIDASGITSVTCALDETPVALTFTDGHYKTTIAGLKPDIYNPITLTATDASSKANESSMTVYIKYEPPVIDTDPPQLIRSSPSEDSTTVNSSSTTIAVEANDESGIVSVAASFGGTDLSVSPAVPVYSVTVSDLVANQFNTIRFIATDASVNGNRETLFVTLYYDPTASDHKKPLLIREAPRLDSSEVGTASTTISVKAKDESGIASVVCSFGSGTPAVTAADSIYSATVTGLVANEFNTIQFIATDASSNGNRETLFVTIKYDPTMTDNEGPVLSRRTPATDSSTISSASTTIAIVAKDASGIASVVCSFGSGTPAVTAADSIYSATVNGLVANEFNTIRFIATDASSNGNRETLFVTIKYDPTMTDNQPPEMSRKIPAQDSISVSSASAKVSIVAKDESGIASVVCTFGTATPVVTVEEDSVYSATITGLVANQFNTIRFIGTDASSNGNRETLFVTVKYDPTMTDNVAPIFTRVSGPESGTTVTTASASYTYTITDDNGVENVYWTLNGTRIADLTAGGTDNNEYSFTATLRSPPHGNSIVIHAQDTSTNHNAGSETITLDYNRPPVANSQTTLTTPRATALSITLTATDPEDDPLSSWTIASNPLHGSITTSRPTFTYTPTGNYEGKDSLTFTVSDGTSTSAAAKIVITVVADNVAPSIMTHPVATQVDKGNSATFTAAINSDVYPAPNYIRWVHNNSDTVSGATNLTCSILADQYADSGNYKVVVRSSAFPTAPAVSNNAKLTVNDVTKPQITLNGSSTVTLNKGSTWTDPSATATDDRDGSITPVRTGSFDIDVVGTYTLTYTATDKAGNSNSVTRTVTVVPVWERFGTATAANLTSLFVLGANEVPHVVQEENNTLVLRKLNTSGSLIWVGELSRQSYNGVSLAVGSDGSTLFVGTITQIDSWSGITWSFVDDVVWNSVGGYGLHIGTGNTPYIAAMHYDNFKMRIWKLNGETWEMVGSDVELPLGSGGTRDKNFCLTSGGQGVYTVGIDWGDPGVSVASLNGLLWNIEKIHDSTGTDHKIVMAGSTLYASFSEGGDYWIYQKVSGWSTTTMSTTGNAASSFDMAVSPSGTLYAARLEGSNAIIKRRVGSSWENVPSTGSATAFTTTSGSKIQILPGSTWCYAIVKTSTQWIVWRISL